VLSRVAGLSVADANMSPMSDASGLRVAAVTPGNVEAACRLSVRPFYERLGFVPAREQFHGEIVGALALAAA
jgi:hypothetical protein